MSRAATGQTCTPHRMGVLPGVRPFFYADCPACQHKKALGIVRGDEGPVLNTYGRQLAHPIRKRPPVILPYPAHGRRDAGR